MADYVYTPLSGTEVTRLFRLRKGYPHDPICLSISNYTLQTLGKANYQALSYAWGSGTKSVPALCLGKKIFITSNLEKALKRLRSNHTERLLWIDQICINQDDIEERGAQVAIMSEIYERARQVIVWLGEESDNSSEALEFMAELTQALVTYNKVHPEQPRLEAEAEGASTLVPGTSVTIPGESDLIWGHVRSLLGRQWFKRLWVIQEVVKGKDVVVQCGALVYPWKLLTTFMQCVGRNALQIATFILDDGNLNGAMLIQRLELAKLSPTPGFTGLAQLLVEFCYQEASDPRDYIYGLLSLCDLDVRRRMEVDYSVSYGHIYTKFTQLLIKDQGRLDILNQVRRTETSHNDFPTWVPDWHMFSESDVQVNPYEKDTTRLSVLLSNRSCFDINLEYGLLTVRGRILSEIKHSPLCLPFVMEKMTFDDTHQRYEFSSSALDYLFKLKEIAIVCSPNHRCGSVAALLGELLFGNDHFVFNGRYLDGNRSYDSAAQSLRRDILRLLLLNHSAALSTGQDFHRSITEEVFHDIIHYPAGPISLRAALWQQELSELPGSDEVLDLMPPLVNICRVGVVSIASGLLARVPQLAMAGDSIALIYGGLSPFVLRSKKGDWELIGECFVPSLVEKKGEDIYVRPGQDQYITLV